MSAPSSAPPPRSAPLELSLPPRVKAELPAHFLQKPSAPPQAPLFIFRSSPEPPSAFSSLNSSSTPSLPSPHAPTKTLPLTLPPPHGNSIGANPSPSSSATKAPVYQKTSSTPPT